MARVFLNLKQATVEFDLAVIDNAVEYLKANPDQEAAFVDAMLGVIHGQLQWHALKTSREAFEALCLILEAVTDGPTNG